MDNSVEKCVPANVLRIPDQGFSQERTHYLAKLAAAKELPKGTEPFFNTIQWPTDMRNTLAHITAYFNDLNYSDPSPDEKHIGLDIQLPLNTPILSPESATVVIVPYNRINEERGLEDILLYSETSGFAYWLTHLDASSLPDKLSKRRVFDKWSNVKVKKGEQLGTVGIFYNKLVSEKGKAGLNNAITIPSDVQRKYGRSYNHLHFEIHYEPDIFKLSYETEKPVDPILFLKKLY